MTIEEIEKQVLSKLKFYEERTVGGMNEGISKSILTVRDLFKKLKQSENVVLDSVSKCVHPYINLSSGDEGLFCDKCQTYISKDSHIC